MKSRSEILRFAVPTGLFLALLAVTRVLPTQTGRGTPSGVLLNGVIAGGLMTITAFGIVLIYRTSRIVNFAQAALGAIGAIFAYNLIKVYSWPFGVAFVIAVVISAALGITTELVLRKFFDAPRLVLTVATIAIMGMFGFLVNVVNGLPLWGDERDLQDIAGGAVEVLPSFSFTVRPYTFRFSHLLSLILVPLALFGVAYFLRRTKMGAAVRAASENTQRAEMLGINVKVLSTVVWSIAGALSGIGVTLAATNTTFAVGAQTEATILVPALAAAVLAGMRSLPLAAVAAVGLAILREALNWSWPAQADPIFSVILVVITVAGPLLMRRRGSVRDRETSSWEAADELRPLPKELTAISEIRTWRNVVVGVVGALVLLLPWITTVGQTNLAGVAAIQGIVLLSLVVLTGWTGQVSLGQFAFVAVGAVVGGALTSKVDIAGVSSFWVAVPLAALVTAGVAALVGVPALRIRGLLLAVSTLAFAFVVNQVLFNEQWFGWLLPTEIKRPTLLLLDFEDERSMYYLCIFFLALSYLFVRTLRKGRPGRALMALRENEDDLAAMGVNPVRTRLTAFAVAGFLAGLAGAVFVHHQRAVTAGSFEPGDSINLFVFAIIGGLGAPWGALLAAGVQYLQQFAPNDPILSFFLNPGFGALVILYLAPRGLAGLIADARDSVLRVVAQRRGIVVPSLFADVDVETIRRRLVPLGAPSDDRGLATVPGDRRYRLRSEVHETRTAARGGAAPDDRKAIAAAAESWAEGQAELVPSAPAANGSGNGTGSEDERLAIAGNLRKEK